MFSCVWEGLSDSVILLLRVSHIPFLKGFSDCVFVGGLSVLVFLQREELSDGVFGC